MKGYIPKSEEVIEFGQKILDYMGECLKHLRQNYQSTVDDYRALTIKKVKENAPHGAITSGMGLVTIISIHTPILNLGKIDYRIRLQEMKLFKLHEGV